MERVRERFWLWGHEAGSHNDGWGLPGTSRITPVEAAYYMGVPNLLMVCYRGKPEPPFDQHALAMTPLSRVVWSIVGDSSSKRNDEKTDLEEVVSLAARFPNITGAIMDDFFHTNPEGEKIGRYGVDDLRQFNERLHGAARRLDLWVVLYTHQLGLPFETHIDLCDVVTFWTWRAPEIADLEPNFDAFEERAPGARKVLGCYLWDFGNKKPMPVDLMQRQCEVGLDWLQKGRIEGMIFLPTCMCDLGLDAVEWTRAWIDKVGDQRIG